MKTFRISLIIILATGLIACGGGGDSPPAAATPGLLAGPGANAAVAALTTTSSGPASAGDIELGHILTRIEIILDPAATIAQFNAAAATVGATSILSSTTGLPGVTLEVPRQSSVGQLNALVSRLDGKAGILFAMPARLFAVSVLPERSLAVPVAKTDLGHLLISRFPQAWNARGAAGSDCLLRLVTVYVWDNFGQQSLRPDFLSQLNSSNFFADPRTAQLSDTDPVGGHGYDVALVLAAKFDATRPTGALPFANCVLIHQVEAANRGMLQATDELKSVLAAEGDDRFILNVSFGFPEPLCGALADTPCNSLNIAATTAASVKRHIRERVAEAVHWALQMRGLNLEPRMLVTLAAGNVDEVPDGFFENRYLGFRDARFVSPAALATHLSELQAVLTNAALWKSDVDANAPDATFTIAEADAVVADVATLLGSSPDMPHSNLVIVDSASCASAGSPSCGEDFSNAGRSDFDYQGGELRAVGEHVQLDGTQLRGTSLSAPQVAGLAAYLWTLSPPLKAEPVSATIDLLKSTGRTTSADQVPVIDAYAATLQLDSIATAEDRRIRSALLDANGDGNFDHLDLVLFREAYQLSDPNRPDIPARDFSRFDLNGDGMTGGIGIASFDLDVNRPAVISTLNRPIEGHPVTFNEAVLSDLQILCFYAYSDLYARAPGNHAEALAERTSVLGESNCAGTHLIATLPAQISTSASLNVTVEVPAGNGQFAPAQNILVTFTPTCGTVNPTSGRTDASGGISTTVSPGSGCSSVTVTAIARANPGTPALATQTVSAVTNVAGRFSGTLTFRGSDTATPTVVGGISLGGTEHFVAIVHVKVEVKPDGTATVLEATGDYSVNATSDVGCNDASLPLVADLPNSKATQIFTQIATITTGAYVSGTHPGSAANLFTDPDSALSLSGISTTTRTEVLFDCGTVTKPEPTRMQPLIGRHGTPVVENGKLVAIDFTFNATIDNNGASTITQSDSGRLNAEL